MVTPQLTVQCYLKNTEPPRGMARGSATTDGQFAYFTPWDSTSVYRYELSTEKWEELPSCPYYNFGLVIIEGELNAVGGMEISSLFQQAINAAVGGSGTESTLQ